ncbi:MarR family transcriptional regulator [Rhodovulum sp. FJ3]|uniref:MarR family winged helix-turn-helix transcriptional regulator n=1 Tax=Rhodovulum sp. FJ3 TaxID=3079053 RepID=UPI00293DE22A|nr:MarR family transcriptional regulator [Rhodovulum sp. FJ3]MDV4166950.1 MarR family transcriptional regulator [Rhodovulum sp. FJ3]
MAFSDMTGHLIRRLHQHAAHVFQVRTKEAGLDLTPVQFAAMDAVATTPGIDQASIAAQIAYDRATIGGVIDRLEQKGWIKRTISNRDRRAREVTLTPTGREILDRAIPVVSALQVDILPGLSEDETSHLRDLIERTTRLIDENKDT